MTRDVKALESGMRKLQQSYAELDSQNTSMSSSRSSIPWLDDGAG